MARGRPARAASPRSRRAAAPRGSDARRHPARCAGPRRRTFVGPAHFLPGDEESFRTALAREQLAEVLLAADVAFDPEQLPEIHDVQAIRRDAAECTEQPFELLLVGEDVTLFDRAVDVGRYACTRCKRFGRRVTRNLTFVAEPIRRDDPCTHVLRQIVSSLQRVAGVVMRYRTPLQR